MTRITKVFNLIFTSTIILLIIFSSIALVSIHMNLLQNQLVEFDLSPNGVEYYLDSFGKYQTLFTSTVATIAGYLGLLRLKVATQANIDKVKQDKFAECKIIIETRFIETEKKNPFMKREFIRKRSLLFDLLYDVNFKIENREILLTIFNKTFKDLVEFFESSNIDYISRGGTYIDKDHSYTFDDFRFLFLSFVETDYPEILVDLRNLYINSLNKDRYVSKSSYAIAGMKL